MKQVQKICVVCLEAQERENKQKIPPPDSHLCKLSDTYWTWLSGCKCM